MPKTLKVKKKHGEKARKLLLNQKALNQNYKIAKDKKNLYLPLKEEIKKIDLIETIKEIEEARIVEKDLNKKHRTPRNLKEALKTELNKENLKKSPSSFDVIGDIAVIELHDDLLNKKELIGEKLMLVHKNINTVLLQTSPVTGEYRVKDLELIAGEDKTKTIHKEHGCRFHIDLSEVFYSPRLSKEREVIMKQVNNKEVVFDMFTGVGPFAIIIAQKKSPKKVYAVDKNEEAFKLLKKNIELNNLQNKIRAIHGDIRNIAPDYPNSSDRVIMNLPFKSGSFLEEAFKLLKKRGGIIHYYDIREEEDLFSEAINEIKKLAKKKGYKTNIQNKRIVRSYSPKTWNIAIDIRAKSF